MINSDKNMNAMSITLIVTKVVFVTIVAFINPWLVVPAIVIAEVVATTFKNKPEDIAPKADKKIQSNSASIEALQQTLNELVIEKVEEPKAIVEPKKRKRRTPKSPDNISNQQVKSSKPRGRRAK